MRCPVCGSGVRLAVGDTQLACTACGLAAPLSRIGTADGTPPAAQLALEIDLTGTTVAGRTLVERVGAGGMGTVYRARGDDGDVAIKILRPSSGTERAAMLARFSREAEAMRRLDHPRVVRFLDHGEQGELAYIVTELVEGRDLAARLATSRLSLVEIVDIFGQVCDGVAAAHAAGIVHRDLKPANILVGNVGVKVADFGLAQLGTDTSILTLTRTNIAMGTFHYLAPEQRKDAHAVDHRADIWALGVILYEMLTGELPLGSFAPPSTLGPAGTDRRVDAIVHRALAPDATARYATVTALARDVRALTAPRKVSRLVLAGATALALAGGATGVAFALSGDDESAPRAAAQRDPAPAVGVIVDAADLASDAAEVATTPPPDANEAAPVDAAPVVAAAGPEAAGSGAGSAAVKPPKPPIKRVTGGKVPVVKVPGGKPTKLGGKGKVPLGKTVKPEGKVVDDVEK
ncbi:MAG: protein kinase domain-containing protein [Kofleriaceae bacterium]